MIQINKEPIYDNTSVKLTLFHSSEKRILFGKFVFKYKNYNWKTYSVHNPLNFSQVLGDRTHHPPFWHPTPFFFSKINKLMFCFHFHGLEICKTAIICRFLIASVDSRCFCRSLVIMCVYVYVHISLFLLECACTTIIDTSLWIFSLMYCCCVSIIIVNCIYALLGPWFG